MANRYNFASTGAAAMQELQQLLAEREALRQQEFLNSITQRKMNLDEEQEDRLRDFQQQNFKDLAYNRESQQVDRMNEDALPGDVIDPENAARYARHRPGVVQSSGAGIAPEAALTSPTEVNVDIEGQLSPEQMASIEEQLTGSVDDLESKETKKGVAPGLMVHRGGTKYLADRKTAEERAERERANNIARADQKERDRASREQQTKDRVAAAQQAKQASSDNARTVRTEREASQVSDRFDRNPITRRMNTIAEQYDTAMSLDPHTDNPADDEALIYIFAKVMDPESVVREGEYNTVMKYAQSWMQKFGIDVVRVLQNRSLLTDEARANLKATLGTKYGAARKTYDNFRKEAASEINRKTGRDDGDSYLKRYEAAYQPVPGGPSAPAGAPAPGAPAAPGVVKWGKDANGRPVRIQ